MGRHKLLTKVDNSECVVIQQSLRMHCVRILALIHAGDDIACS